MEPDQLNDSLKTQLSNIAESYGITLKEKKCGPAFSELIKALHALPHTELPDSTDKAQTEMEQLKFSQLPVLLIDEYDCPLTSYLSESKELQKNRKILQNFYLNIKSSSYLIRFGFITGITLFQKLSVFSTMNSFQNITFNSAFSKICGFTEAEIKTYYKKIINSSFLTMKKRNELPANWKKQDFINAIFEWYDGYSWDDVSRLLNPQSVKDFFDLNEFNNYWYATAGPQFLEQLKFINKSNFLKIFDDNLDIPRNSISPNLSFINPYSALFQCGYLTIDTKDNFNQSLKKYIYLKVPNKEVKLSIAQDYLIQHFFPNLTKEERDGLCIQYENFSDFFIRHDSKNAASALSSIFENFSHRAQKSGEHFFQSQTKTGLAHAGRIMDEYSVGCGDIDLVLERYGASIIYVIEIKYRKSPVSSERGDNSEIADLKSHSTSSVITSDIIVSPEPANDAKIIKFDAKENREKRTLEEQLKVQHALELAVRDAFEQIRQTGIYQVISLPKQNCLSCCHCSDRQNRRPDRIQGSHPFRL
jgi:hypothetical protein